MNLLTHFTALLDEQNPDLDHNKQLWNRRAAEVSQFTVTDDDFALQTVQRKLELQDSRVLEISFGGGRHLLQFLRRGAAISGVEISANMLTHTRQKLAASGLQWKDDELVQSSWEAVELARLGWEQAFDLVFLYMSPAISSSAMLKKVLAACRGHLYLALYSDRDDSLLTELQDEFGLERKSVSARSADDLYNIFNALYQWGYFPELQFEERLKANHHDPDYILERYTSWLWRDEADDDKRAQLRVALEKRAVDGRIHTQSRDVVGHLVVDTRLRSSLRS